MPSNKDKLNEFQENKLNKIKEQIENSNDGNNKDNFADSIEDVTTNPPSSNGSVEDIEEGEVEGEEDRKIQTALGTEMNLSDLQKNVKAANKEQTKFQKDLRSILVSVSDERLTKITDALKKGILKLERVKDDGSGVVVENKDYIPLTIGQNKKVMKIMKRARLLREDIQGLGKDKGGLMVSDIQNKYPDILEEDVTQDELNNEDALNEFIGNYVVAQKAKIYWGIDSIDNYVLSDIILIIGLYEQRNNFTPT